MLFGHADRLDAARSTTAATYTIQGQQLELRTPEDALVALVQASGG